jgi:hypothetical protein
MDTILPTPFANSRVVTVATARRLVGAAGERDAALSLVARGFLGIGLCYNENRLPLGK